MNRIYSFLLVPILLLSLGVDCQVDFDCRPIVKVAKTEYSLELKLREGPPEEFLFELYDLSTGNVVSKKKAFFGEGESKVIFENVKPSTYTVYFSSTSCSKKKSITGKGIVLQ